ncbi:hypothetical protein BCT05_06860 [Vibrio breoganii]|uniref:sulfotransferase family 2 domain-containing protein n=1 Tax=Vibrio breoganii TaxID=553239 RepID=UPI000C8467BF|nr:sulfotransferase family 2 domain-containing protein [Vibrio breoganii]PMO67491.1 hypothetical protein BCT05_06860 [Vibrio breoganii]
MPIFTKKDSIVLFVHIPKSAGTTVKDLFIQNDYNVILGNKNRKIEFPCTPQHYHNEILEYLNLNSIEYRFTVVRNPITRLFSEYKFRGYDKIKYITFDVFVHAAFKLYKLDKYCFDNHIRPQSEFISEGLIVYKFEDGIEEIRNSFVKKSLIDSSTIISHKRKSKKATLQFNSSTLRNIMDFYKEDFSLFNYETPKFELVELGYLQSGLNRVLSSLLLIYFILINFVRKFKNKF